MIIWHSIIWTNNSNGTYLVKSVFIFNTEIHLIFCGMCNLLLIIYCDGATSVITATATEEIKVSKKGLRIVRI